METNKEYQLRLVRFMLRIVKDSWLAQERIAFEAEAKTSVTRNIRELEDKEYDNNYGGGGRWGPSSAEIIKQSEEFASRERTEAKARKDAYELLLNEILNKYVN
jgi:hypothetical protein